MFAYIIQHCIIISVITLIIDIYIYIYIYTCIRIGVVMRMYKYVYIYIYIWRPDAAGCGVAGASPRGLDRQESLQIRVSFNVKVMTK